MSSEEMKNDSKGRQQQQSPSAPFSSTSTKGENTGELSKSRESSAASVSSDATARTGVCKWFNVVKGWGFITADDGGPEVFVHQSVLQMAGFRSLDQGEPVEFFDKQTDRGFEATIVTGPGGLNCKGSTVRPLGKKKFSRIRCFNCGQYGNHIAAKCHLGSMPKSCYHCRASDHLIADCPQRRKPNDEPSGPTDQLDSSTNSTKNNNHEKLDNSTNNNQKATDGHLLRREEK